MLTDIFRTVLRLSLEGSLIAAIILLIRALFGSRLPSRLPYWLWMLLLIRLMLPITPANPLGFISADIPAAQSVSTENAAAPLTETAPVKALQNAPSLDKSPLPVSVPENGASKDFGPIFWETASLVWLAGAVLVFACFLFSATAARQKLKKGKCCQNKTVLAELRSCQEILNFYREIPVICVSAEGSPFAVGVRNPKIVLPSRLAENLSAEELRYILLHELIHIRRRDTAINILTLVLRAVHWFNPLLWAVFWVMKGDGEISCDAEVLKRLGKDERHAYGQAIVSVLELQTRPNLRAGAAGFAGRFNKRRLIMILHQRKTSLLCTATAAVLVLLAGCASFPGAKRQPLSAAGTSRLATASQPAVSFPSSSSYSISSRSSSEPAVQATAASHSRKYTSLDDFAKKNGYSILVDSGRIGTLQMPKSFFAVVHHEKVGEYLKACNAFSSKYGLNFSRYLGKKLTLEDHDSESTRNGGSYYLFGLYNGNKLVGVWVEKHQPATNDKRATMTFGGLYTEGCY